MSLVACVILNTTQFISPKEFPLNHFRNLTEKTRWPHQLPWKSRDPSAVISSLKVRSDSLLWLAKLPTLGIRSAETLILFSCLSFCSSLLLLSFCSLHTLNISHGPSSDTPYFFHLHFSLIYLCPSMHFFSLGIVAPHWSFQYPVEAFSSVSKIKTCPLWFPSEGPRQWEI